jgi:hypothetical protein
MMNGKLSRRALEGGVPIEPANRPNITTAASRVEATLMPNEGNTWTKTNDFKAGTLLV